MGPSHSWQKASRQGRGEAEDYLQDLPATGRGHSPFGLAQWVDYLEDDEGMYCNLQLQDLWTAEGGQFRSCSLL